MDLFKCSLDELAQRLSEKPELYTHATCFLETSKKILSGEIDVDKTLALINQANNIARESDYYVFQLEDTWANERGFQEQGFGVYQKTNNKLMPKFGLGDLERPATFDETVNFLKKKKITQTFTAYVCSTGGYFGLENSIDDEDGHSIEYDSVDRSYRKNFKNNGIEVTFLGEE